MRLLSSRFSSILLGSAFAAISITASGCAPDYPACKRDKHCKVEEGETCVEGTCQNCVTDDECVGKGENGENWTCHEFRCTDPAELPPTDQTIGGIGAPCVGTAECSGGLVCREGKCDVCMADTDCDGGSCNLDVGRCESPMSSSGSCQLDDDCAMDEICIDNQCVFPPDIETGAECGLETVFFEFDSPKLSQDTQDQLTTAAPCFAELSTQGRTVILEGHADGRGTFEYNILLTEKRSQSVRKFLENLGVPGASMQPVSKGSIMSSATDETGYSKERRVDFLWPTN